MKLSLEAISVIDAIERRGSFAAAATELHRVPSAVTYTVSKLEDDLDIALFDRSGHRASLTSAGRTLLEEGRHLLVAAGELENRVRRVATGWESELHIAVCDLVNLDAVLELVEAFDAEKCGTRIRLMQEVFGGNWDALVSGRADLAIGAPGEAPAGGGLTSQPIGQVEFAFAVAPAHPLATMPEPISNAELRYHRSVSAADSSRNLPPRTSGVLSGQEILTVQDMQAKYRAQLRGLGVGFLPRSWLQDDFLSGRLVEKRVEECKEQASLSIAWSTGRRGKALSWFIKQLGQPEIAQRLLAAPAR
jgi:DNA-binding transcriptional LysR family regulator